MRRRVVLALVIFSDHEYQNPNWVLINLYDYGISRNDSAIIEFVRATVRKHFLPVTRPCSVQDEQTQWQECMPVCTVWAYMVVHTSPPDDLRRWLGRFFPADAIRRLP